VSARRVARVVRGQAASDGAGVRLNRVIGGQHLEQLDPFLLLDEFRSDSAADYMAGFPNHPHRGFETVTYMLAGRMRHGDNQGNSGLLTPGSVQWMTAGRGIVHSEMPEQEDGLMQGFQLWVNLPAKDKMTAPRYQDIAPERIPELDAGQGAHVRVIAGGFNAVAGPVQAQATEPVYLDVSLKPGGEIEVPVPQGHNAFVYVFEGAVELEGREVEQGSLAVLSAGDKVSAKAPHGGRFILVAGKPLNEPVARYGPFVMNTREEIQQAVRDFSEGRL
jgi:redox-sensitive bicupin YhaK (pirin superfamily)